MAIVMSAPPVPRAAPIPGAMRRKGPWRSRKPRQREQFSGKPGLSADNELVRSRFAVASPAAAGGKRSVSLFGVDADAGPPPGRKPAMRTAERRAHPSNSVA
jgi:hypothetical protein